MTMRSKNMFRSSHNLVVRAACSISVSNTCLTGILKIDIATDRATEPNLKANTETAKTKLKLPLLAVGSQAFIGEEVKRQMERVANNVEYQELKFGHQLAEECPDLLADLYLSFLKKL